MIKNEYPPNYTQLKVFFDLKKNCVFSYYPDIYNPDKIFLDPSLLRHEERHLEQQEEYGVEKWWARYLIDPKFRASQEVSAYQCQYRELKKHIKDRNKLYLYTRELAKDLSGENYGKVMNFDEAINAIQEEKLIEFDIEKK